METVPNFTPRAQEALEIAKSTAQENSSSVIDICHLAYGVLFIKSASVRRALDRSGIDFDALANYVSALVEDNKNFNGEEGAISFSHHGSQLLTIAVLCADKMDHGYVGVDHLFLALSQYDHSPINTFTIEMGIDPKANCRFFEASILHGGSRNLWS